MKFWFTDHSYLFYSQKKKGDRRNTLAGDKVTELRPAAQSFFKFFL